MYRLHEPQLNTQTVGRHGPPILTEVN